MPNIQSPTFEDDDRPDGFRSRRARIGYELGTEKVGVSLWEIPAGQAAYPYHFHYTEEEVVVVLSGNPSLRTPDGIRELQEGEVVRFPIREAGSHQLVNRTTGTVTFLAISNHGSPDIVVYPDSNKIGVNERRPSGGGLRELYRRETAVGYWDREQP